MEKPVEPRIFSKETSLMFDTLIIMLPELLWRQLKKGIQNSTLETIPWQSEKMIRPAANALPDAYKPRSAP